MDIDKSCDDLLTKLSALSKRSFVPMSPQGAMPPPPPDPASGPPMVDPSMGGAMPPGGAPPMDPSMMGGGPQPPGMPPMPPGGDPNAGGPPGGDPSAGGPPGAVTVSLDDLRQLFQEVAGSSGKGSSGAPAEKPKKATLDDVSQKLDQLMQLLATPMAPPADQMPPGGPPPPPDASAAGGAPPMDPSMMGGSPPPGGAPMDGAFAPPVKMGSASPRKVVDVAARLMASLKR